MTVTSQGISSGEGNRSVESSERLGATCGSPPTRQGYSPIWEEKKHNIPQRISVLSRSDGVTALPASATVSVDGSRALGVTGDGDNQPAAQVRQTSFNLEPNQVKTRANTAQG